MSATEPRLEILKDRPIAVFGLARTGLSVIKALQGKVQIYAWDDDAYRRDQAGQLGAEVESFTSELLKKCACLVLSPGVPLDHEVVEKARIAGIEILCDIELFCRLYPFIRTVGITGTNGKSTTTALAAHILQSCGVPAEACGNIGRPIFDVLPDREKILVLELSSYQLDLCPTFRPDVAVLLNIAPDHLDRHGSMDNYIHAKKRIFDSDNLKLIGVDDDYSRKIFNGIKKSRSFSVQNSVEDGAYVEDDMLYEVQGGQVKESGRVEKLPALKGTHNYQNLLAAYLIARHYEIPAPGILKAAASFPGLDHRQYVVRTLNGVTFINDSKGTNVQATSKALGSYTDIFWIVGGRAKEGGLRGLELYMNRVRHAYLIGESMESFSGWMLENKVSFTLCETLEKAVAEAAAHAAADTPSTVLLSPACASWDQYSSFEDRGYHFTTLVNQLAERKVP